MKQLILKGLPGATAISASALSAYNFHDNSRLKLLSCWYMGDLGPRQFSENDLNILQFVHAAMCYFHFVTSKVEIPPPPLDLLPIRLE